MCSLVPHQTGSCIFAQPHLLANIKIKITHAAGVQCVCRV